MRTVTTITAMAMALCILVSGLPALAEEARPARQSLEILVAVQDAPQVQYDDGFGDEAPAEVQAVADPFEGWNRFWFEFNDRFYFWFLKPLAQGYEAVTPEELRLGVRNFFDNALFPVRFANLILQGKFLGAGVEAQRFIANTAFGFLGLVDIAEDRKGIVETDAEDFGQTLGYYGLGNGPYIVWPILGPSTLRDSLGLVGDYFADPLTYLKPWYKSAGVKGYRGLNETSLRIGDYEALKKSAVEPYSAMRNAYIQHRREKVKK